MVESGFSVAVVCERGRSFHRRAGMET